MCIRLAEFIMQELIINFSDGNIHTIYNEDIDLAALGRLNINRASYVEPDKYGYWYADMSPIHPVKLGPFRLRSEALEAEHKWLTEYFIKN